MDNTHSSLEVCNPIRPGAIVINSNEEGDEEMEEEGMEEAHVPKVRRGPEEPTDAERKVHEVTHIQFRNWCEACVQAKAESTPHYKAPKEDESSRLATTFH